MGIRSIGQILTAKRQFAHQLAINTPLVTREAKVVLKKINYDPQKALDIVAGKVCPREPRATFFQRVLDAVRSR